MTPWNVRDGTGRVSLGTFLNSDRSKSLTRFLLLDWTFSSLTWEQSFPRLPSFFLFPFSKSRKDKSSALDVRSFVPQLSCFSG